MRKTEARLYAVSISEPPGAGPQPVGGLPFHFHWTSTLCVVVPGWGQRSEDLSHQHPSCTPLLSMGIKQKLLSNFAGVAHHGDVPIESLKRSQSKKRTTRVVGLVVSAGCLHTQVCSCLCFLGKEKQMPLPCPCLLVGCPGTLTVPTAPGASQWLHQQETSSCGNSTKASRQ